MKALIYICNVLILGVILLAVHTKQPFVLFWLVLIFLLRDALRREKKKDDEWNEILKNNLINNLINTTMLVKTNKTNRKGNRIYVNALNGKEITLPYAGHKQGCKGNKMPQYAFNKLIQPLPLYLR